MIALFPSQGDFCATAFSASRIDGEAAQAYHLPRTRGEADQFRSPESKQHRLCAFQGTWATFSTGGTNAVRPYWEGVVLATRVPSSLSTRLLSQPVRQ